MIQHFREGIFLSIKNLFSFCSKAMKLFRPSRKQLCSSGHFRAAAAFRTMADSLRLSCCDDFWRASSRSSSESSTTNRKAASSRSCSTCCSRSPTETSEESWSIWSLRFRGIWWTMTEIICGRNFSSSSLDWQARRRPNWKNLPCCFLGKKYEGIMFAKRKKCFWIFVC